MFSLAVVHLIGELPDDFRNPLFITNTLQNLNSFMARVMDYEQELLG